MQPGNSQTIELSKPRHFFLILTLVFSFLALGSASYLDYWNFQQGKENFLPWTAASQEETKPTPEFSLKDYLRQELGKIGLNLDMVKEEEQEDGFFYFSVNSTAEEYRKLKPEIMSRLKKKKIKINLKEEKSRHGEMVATLELSSKSRASGWLIFKYPVQTSAKTTRKSTQPEPVASVPRPEPKKVAIVIDDLGGDLAFLQELINLKVPLTVAIIPELALAKESAELAERNNLEVIIHLPLEAFNHQTGGAEGLIRTSMSPVEVRQILERNLSILPSAKGLNNHMGSKATADESLMEIIISFLKDHDLYFLDSKTSSRSIAYELALKKKVPAAARHIFLDADEDRRKIPGRIVELFNLARKKGQAIGIGHPYPETLEALKTYLPKAADYDLQVVPVSALVKK